MERNLSLRKSTRTDVITLSPPTPQGAGRQQIPAIESPEETHPRKHRCQEQSIVDNESTVEMCCLQGHLLRSIKCPSQLAVRVKDHPALVVFTIAYRTLRKAAGYTLLTCCSLFAVFSGRKIIFLTTPFGDLGNRLFLFSNILGFSLENNATVIHLGLGPWRAILEGAKPGPVACHPTPSSLHIQSPLIENVVKTIAWSAEAIASSRYSLEQWAAIRINNSKLSMFEMVDMDGQEFREWFRNKHVLFLSGYQYLASESIRLNQNRIRKYLRLLVSETDPLVVQYKAFEKEHDCLTGVIIRHGDYRHFMGGRYFYETSRYVEWIQQMVKLLPGKRQGFIITGNDGITPQGLEDIDFLFAPHEQPATRLILSRCDRIISPPSSYAGWCAFSGDIPLLLITSQHQQMDLADFRPILNHTDLRDTSMPAQIDITRKITQG